MMLNLKLRDEFTGDQMPGTAIALRKQDNTGAIQQSADRILAITYPTSDVQTALRALSPGREKRPIVLMGERGRGKSHIMAVMHHALASPDQVEIWAREWGVELNAPVLRDLKLARGFFPISEPVHNHEYPLLWHLLFDRHPKGDFFRGKFEQSGSPYPSRSLLEEMFEKQPVALILDEFQKWFDGLSDQSGPEGIKYRTWAENFIQNLSELSKDRPELLIFVISILNNNTEAFRQVHRDGPMLIDFRGPTAKQDRQRLLLYRLFENRRNIAATDIENLTAVYSSERFRLRFAHLSDAERPRIAAEVTGCWPFSPELIELLEDHVLLSQAAQETRDMIRILASVFRSRGAHSSIITPADFHVDDDTCGVQSLLDSIATVGEQEHLREIAQRNLENIVVVAAPIPHARELVSSIWIRSMSPSRLAGGTRNELHLDITRANAVDDNQFDSELVQLVENSINIHGEDSADGRLRFRTEDNPRTKVRSCAKNDKLWQPGAATPVAGQTTYPGNDVEHIRNTLRHILVPESRQTNSRVIVLGPRWKDDPWSEVDDQDRPARWEQPVLITLPESVAASPDGRSHELGRWLIERVPAKRNTVRFLIPSDGAPSFFSDRDLVFSARCSYLVSVAWREEYRYRNLKEEFDKPLRDALRKRFDRFAVLRNWDYRNPDSCTFDIERIGAQGADIPATVEDKILSDLFDPAAFEKFVLERAGESSLVGDVLDELLEPPPPGRGDTIPYLGATPLYEEVLKIASRGKIVVNVAGKWVGRQPTHETDEEALRFIRGLAFRSGNEMRAIQLGSPSVVGGTTVTGQATQAPISGLIGPTTPVAPPAVQPPIELPVIAPPTGVIKAVPRTCRSEEPSSGINLSGLFESWGVANETILETARVEFSKMTAQQVKQILQRLPSNVRASIEIAYGDVENET